MMNRSENPSSADQSWRGHLIATMKLGMPLIASQLAIVGIGVTDTIMLGWLGAETLAASVLGTQLYFLTMIAGSGIAHALMPIVANALGADDHVHARRATRMAIWGALIFCLLACWHLWFSKPVLLLFGQDVVLSGLAQDYLRIAVFALPLVLIFNTMRSYLSAHERAGIVMWVTVIALIVNGIANYAFIFGNLGAPALGIRGAAVATLFTNGLMMVMITSYAAGHPALRQYELLRRLWVPDWAALRECFRLGIPIALTILAEVSLFSISSLMMGWVGVIELAAHGVALQIASIAFMIPLGLSFAGTVRIGRMVGRQDLEGLRRSAIVVTVVAIVAALGTAFLLVAIPKQMIALFLDSENPDTAQIIAVGVPLLFVAAIFQLFDTLQVIALGFLRGIKDTRVPLFIAVLSYLVFGVATAYVLGFVFDYGGVGIWLGLTAGLVLAAILLIYRFITFYRTVIT